jgi:hypothetical protein
MILDAFGVLDTAGAKLTNATTISENVIKLPEVDFSGITDIWLVIDTAVIATGDGSDTFKFQLVADTQVALDGTSVEIVSHTITGKADVRLATAGRRIFCVNLGEVLMDPFFDPETYMYLGLNSIISDGATISINAALSTVKPQSDVLYNRQVTRSPVGLPG